MIGAKGPLERFSEKGSDVPENIGLRKAEAAAAIGVGVEEENMVHSVEHDFLAVTTAPQANGAERDWRVDAVWDVARAPSATPSARGIRRERSHTGDTAAQVATC